MMRSTDVETSLERGVYLWCLIGLSSPVTRRIGLPGGAATTVFVAALSSGCFIYGPSRGSPDADVRKRRRLVTTGATAYGVSLYAAMYAATRLLFRRWSLAAIVGVSLGVSYATLLGLAALERLDISSQHLYNMGQRLYGMQNKWNATIAEVENRYTRTPLVFLDIGFRLSYMSFIIVLKALFGLRSRELPLFRMWVREWRRKLLIWASPSPLLRPSGPSYQYQSLPNCSPETPKIRLLKLQRRWPLGHINCELITVDLHSDLQYDAISYPWGRAPFTEEIYIDGLTFKVLPIVQELLYHLSSYQHDRILWIDAICINQLNSAEKDIQIRLMRDVYHRATYATVWLDGVQEPLIARSMLAGTYAGSGWMQLMNLSTHPWFCRTWVIQAIAMARASIILASGELLLFDHIATFAYMMHSCPCGIVHAQEDAIFGLNNTELMARIAENHDNPWADRTTASSAAQTGESLMQSLDDVFWRSLLADTQLERPAPAELGVGCRIWESATFGVAGLELGNTEHRDGMNEALQRLSLEWNSARANGATGRALGVTKEGYVSLVPPDTRVGDLVCVFYGLNTPFVLRPQVMVQDDGQESPARLVGETHVHGMMDGEAFSIPDTQPCWFSIV
ncbi:heterokaryon incompatibility protein-domain-containing protein [Nemania sp. NC0429]|nr:heterokaryon incompatibility protein-domain-containing protein [Nemania sp. NC0429]